MRWPDRLHGMGIRATLVAALAALACASAPPAPSSLAVKVLSGAPSSARTLGESPAPPPRVAVVVDLSSSMRTPVAAGGPSRAAAARAAAIRLLDSLPPATGVLIEALGAASGSSCTAPIALEAGPGPSGTRGSSTPASLSAPLQVLAPHSESSLADTLGSVEAAIRHSGSSAGWHVVVLSDLGAECGGDPCDAIAGLVRRGIPVDVVSLGDDAGRTCAPPPPPVPALASRLAPAPSPAFRLEAPPHAGAPVTILAHGTANSAPVAVPSGRSRILVDLHPPLAIGPVSLAPGEQALLRILDFPAAQPPLRVWRMNGEPLAKGGAGP